MFSTDAVFLATDEADSPYLTIDLGRLYDIAIPATRWLSREEAHMAAWQMSKATGEPWVV